MHLSNSDQVRGEFDDLLKNSLFALTQGKVIHIVAGLKWLCAQCFPDRFIFLE